MTNQSDKNLNLNGYDYETTEHTGHSLAGANPDEPTNRNGENLQANLAGMLDHTILKPDATQAALTQFCQEAKHYQFASVCVNSCNIAQVAELLQGSPVKPIAVVGFPLGAMAATAKAFETRDAIQAGAEEIDMVINLGALKSQDYRTVYEDIRMVVDAANPYPVKVIIEASALDHDEKVAACILAQAAGAAFVKTSTGFGAGGATVEDVTLMKKLVGKQMKIKASGGIRSREDAERMIQAGADRLGTSASIAIVAETSNKG